jgi:P27 family predicted phage terminase small subunit
LLQKRRVLTSGDVELLRLYCFLYERHCRNVALLREEGELCTYERLDSNGVMHPQVKVNLRLKICQDSERQMAGILNQLGLTPVSKDRAKPARDEEPTVELTAAERYMKELDERTGIVPFAPRLGSTPMTEENDADADPN